MIRTIFAVALAFIAFALLTTVLWALFGYDAHVMPPRVFLGFSLLCEIFFALGAGAFAAWFARDRAVGASKALAGVMLASGFASLVFNPAGYPLWVPWSTILLLAPACFFGGTFLYKPVHSSRNSNTQPHIFDLAKRAVKNVDSRRKS